MAVPERQTAGKASHTRNQQKTHNAHHLKMMLSRLIIKRRAVAIKAIGQLSRRHELKKRLVSTAAKGFAAREESSNWHFGVMGAAALLIAQQQQEETLKCEAQVAATEPWKDPAVVEKNSKHGPRKLSNKPKNVMLHRMRSLRARSLNDKYNVDWDNVIGEGAYGSVHPARLALTGEKVRP